MTIKCLLSTYRGKQPDINFSFAQKGDPQMPVHRGIAAAAAAKSLQSCPTLCDPVDSSPPGSSVHGILQARVLEWGAIAFSESML